MALPTAIRTMRSFPDTPHIDWIGILRVMAAYLGGPDAVTIINWLKNGNCAGEALRLA
jgi:hypothetical protein